MKASGDFRLTEQYLFATAAPLFSETDDHAGFPTLKRPKLGSFLVKNIFTDLKRHDLGPNFYERNYDGTLRTQFLTTPLWGVGSTAPYGHDVLTISSDGKWIACYHPDEHNNDQLQVLIFPFEGGQPVKAVNLPKTADPFNGRPLWSPDGRSITFANRVNNVPNIWSQPVDGGPPKPITNFQSLWLYNYAVSRDGKQLALSRGDQYQDIVLIKDFR